MITLMSEALNFDTLADAVPARLITQARDASRKITDPVEAKAIFDELAPALKDFQPDQEFSVACGLLIEKQRRPSGMLDFWTDLRRIFPQDLTALRMMMRWYRRERRTQGGIAQLHMLFPHSHMDLAEAEYATLGFAELRAFDEIDQLMDSILPTFPSARALRMRYIKVLNQQSRYLDAQAVADTVQDADKMGLSSRTLIDTANRRAAKMTQLYTQDAADVFTQIIDALPVPKPSQSQALGALTFYTGQLGTGGAERQMTRLAGAFQSRFQRGMTAGGLALTGACDVAVRHTTPESGADFYVPTLRRYGVDVASLEKLPDVQLSALENIPTDVINLLELLPEDVFDATCKLIPHFQARKTEVAYLWQDGGVLFASLAALIAGVPRIVTSFRGLPPNLRPNLYRPELPVLYAALARLPHVTFSANSHVAARAYEDWLGLARETVLVIPNAVLPISPEGDAEDIADWVEIEKQSWGCTQTVLGVFRFDENKRPLLWIETAATYLKTNPNTRFVMLGTGYLFGACQNRIAELGLEDRIFLTGVREKVGFYMHKADLVMHLAKMEGLPNVLIEAQLAGCPVLATPAGGTAEVMRSGATGLILNDAEDPSVTQICTDLHTLLSDPKRLKHMGHAAHEHATPRFLIDNIIDRTAQLFAQTRGF